MIADLKRVILVHGFASPFSGKFDIDTYGPYWLRAGYEVLQFDYGFRLFVSIRNDKWARRLKEVTLPGDTVLAHSNGCLVAQKASLLGAPFDRLVLLCPALDVDAEFGEQVRRIDVWYAAHDYPTKISQFLPGHSWGPMGALGYRGTNPKVVNHDRESFPVKSYTHLDLLYDKEKRDYFGPLTVRED